MDLNNEDNLKNKEDLHIAGRHAAMDIFRFAVFFMYLIFYIIFLEERGGRIFLFYACCMMHDDDEWYMIHDELLVMDA